MDKHSQIAVCSRSFSRNEALRSVLDSRYEHIRYNDEGLSLSGQELVSFLQGCNKVIVGLEVVDADILSGLPELKVVSKYGVGLDMLDLAAMRDHGVRLGWTPGVNKRSVTELVIAFAISMLRRVPECQQKVRAGEFRQIPGGLLTGRTVGIIGCGNIGQDLVPILNAFGCDVQAYDIRDYSAFYEAHGVRAVDLETLLRTSDIVTLHVPLDSSTRQMLDKKALESLRSTAILINLARGDLVDETCLKEMLQDGRLAAAAFDVFAPEPPTDMELLALPNFLATPHIGGSAVEAIHAMGMAAIEGLEENTIPELQASTS